MRAQKQNPDGVIDDEMQLTDNVMKDGGDLDLLANVTCPENKQEVQRLMVDQAVHLVSHVAQQVGCNIEQQGLDSAVVGQEGNMAAQEGDIAAQEDDVVQQEDDMVPQGDIVPQEDDIVAQESHVVADGNHMTEDEVAMEHDVVQLQQQEVSSVEVQAHVQQTIQIDQSNGLCEQHIQVGELEEQENVYV